MDRGRVLVERDLELSALDRALHDARAETGRVLLFSGPAGIGKTALLAEARRRAASVGVAALVARGGELETGLPYGVIRQLLELEVRSSEPPRARRLLMGAASLAAPAVLGPDAGSMAAADSGFSVLHGLYWLVVNLAGEAPLALIVDDVHWSDPPSLRFLAYLARRLAGLPVTVIASVRTGEDGSGAEFMRDLTDGPGTEVLRPAPLSDLGVASLLSDAFGRRPDPQFVQACARVTGGSPFLVRELAAALLADGIEPRSESAALLDAVGPAAIARTTLGRLAHLSKDAVELARAIAVLGGDSRLARAARLTGLDQQEALTAFDALVAADVVTATDRLEFVHPVVRTSVYEEIAPGERSIAHSRIAELLRAEGAEIDVVAGHLLLTRPVGSPETTATLREAAVHALALGAPDSAATYLERAVQEAGGREQRATLLLELAGAEKLAGQQTALAHLNEAIRVAEDPVMRATAMIELAEVMVFAGAWEEPLALFAAALLELGDRNPGLALRADTLRMLMTANDTRLVAVFEQRVAALDELVAAGGASARPLALALAGAATYRGADRTRILELVERGWDEGRFLTDFAGDPPTLSQGLWALAVVDELGRAHDLLEATRESARERGSVYLFALASLYGALLAVRNGSLLIAEAELRSCLETSLEIGVLFAIPSLFYFAMDVLLERPDAAELAAFVETIELGPMAEVCSGAFMFEVRGRLRFAAGQRDAAIADLSHAGAIHAALGSSNPNMIAWRSTLALMLPPSERDQALGLAGAELADAQLIGQPRGIGVALRALGMLESDAALAREHLTGAVAALASSPSRLEHARALVELGAALRRTGSRSEARKPLREGLEIATRCGALRLADRALIELTAAGAKPRRPYVSGPDALTASELRVAQLAAAGQTSAQIAQALFVTTKTIDAHLQHAYSKLSIHSRRELAAALATHPEAGTKDR